MPFRIEKRQLPLVRDASGLTKMDALDGSQISVEWALADGSVATFSATIETRETLTVI